MDNRPTQPSRRSLASSRLSRRAFVGGGAVAASTVVVGRNGRALAQQVSGLQAGMALVSSPRLPLFGVRSADVAGLLSGQVPTWDLVGSPTDLSVEPIAIDGLVPAGMTPVETVADYAGLAEALDRRPGAVAMIPADQVDFRANVLSVDGYDPVRDEAIGGEELVTVGMVGDIVPGRNVGNKMKAYGDYTHPFHKVAAQLSAYDYVVANLEGNLSDTIEIPTEAHTFTFVSSPQMLEGFQLAGIDAVTLGNNHSCWNSEGWGTQGLTDTMNALDTYGIGRFGAGWNIDEARAPLVADVRGRKVAFFGIDGVTANQTAYEDESLVWDTWAGGAGFVGATADAPGTNPYFLDQVLADISAASATCDIVIPYFHCGIEYVMNPPQWAVQGMRAAIDAGATMVVTNHPHLVQGMEVYNGKPIFYSVGNFIFDQMFSVEVRQGFILELAFRGGQVIGLRPRGVEIEDFNQPRLMNVGEHASQMDRFWASTDRLRTLG